MRYYEGDDKSRARRYFIFHTVDFFGDKAMLKNGVLHLELQDHGTGLLQIRRAGSEGFYF